MDVAVGVARGNGWLVRLELGLLWTPSETRPDALIDSLASGTSAVTDAVVAAGFVVDPFALVSWAGGVHVVVLGPVEVTTDAPSMPMLSGGRSRTWVEHRPDAAELTIRAGDEADTGTELHSGVVRAGGFRLALATRTADLAEGAPLVATAAPPASPPLPPPPPSAPAPQAAELGVSLLRSVTGGDWMEDSIGITADPPLRPARRSPVGTPTVVIDGTPAAELHGPVVVGRQPDRAASGTDDAVSCTVTGDPAVSRTHLIVRADGATVTVTDCGSSAGSVLVTPGVEAVEMAPWAPYDLGPDDVVRFGGGTTLTVER